MSRGGKAIVPGTPEDPVQVIDVRDLAEWMALVGEKKFVGVFNAVGGAKPYRFGDVIEACRKASKTPAEARWTSAKEVEEHGLSFPIWAPGDGEYAGIHRVKNDRAVAAGLRFRSLDTICKDTLAWFEELPEEKRAKFMLPSAGKPEERKMLTPEVELEILAKLDAQH
jgi:2'-hydroxyisoflavone reductase